ncbi:hypothetical protein ES708_03231 [subsurface metagenome]
MNVQYDGIVGVAKATGRSAQAPVHILAEHKKRIIHRANRLNERARDVGGGARDEVSLLLNLLFCRRLVFCTQVAEVATTAKPQVPTQAAPSLDASRRSVEEPAPDHPEPARSLALH